MQFEITPLPNGAFGSMGALDIVPSANSTTGAVFAHREFETKLVQFAVSEVASTGRMPPDEAIQARAKELAGFEVWQAATTPADDPVLLAGFKTLVVDKVKAVLGSSTVHRAATATATQAPGRGLDVIDPGLLQALDGKSAAAETAPAVYVALSESRLDEIIMESLQR